MKHATEEDLRRPARVLFGAAAEEALCVLDGDLPDMDPLDVRSWAMSPEQFARGFGAGAARADEAAN